jgi:hypothetical protein
MRKLFTRGHKFKKGDKIALILGSGAEKREGIVIDTMRKVTKCEITYTNPDGNVNNFEGWFKNEQLKKIK